MKGEQRVHGRRRYEWRGRKRKRGVTTTKNTAGDGAKGTREERCVGKNWYLRYKVNACGE